MISPQTIGRITSILFHPSDPALLKESIAQFHPKDTMQSDKMADLDGAVSDAVKLKFLDKPMTKEQLTEFLQIPQR